MPFCVYVPVAWLVTGGIVGAVLLVIWTRVIYDVGWDCGLKNGRSDWPVVVFDDGEWECLVHPSGEMRWWHAAEFRKSYTQGPYYLVPSRLSKHAEAQRKAEWERRVIKLEDQLKMPTTATPGFTTFGDLIATARGLRPTGEPGKA